MFLWGAFPSIKRCGVARLPVCAKSGQRWRLAAKEVVVMQRDPVSLSEARNAAAVGPAEPCHYPTLFTRRAVIQSWVLAAAGSLLASPAGAEKTAVEENALPREVKNLLELYVDLQRGYKMYRPKGWNEFDGDPGNTKYEKKFQDIIQPLEFVTVYSIPVTQGKTLESLGDAEAVGRRLAEKRGATLVAANQKESNGILYYIFEYVREPAHQLSLLTIHRGRLYSVNASASDARWKRLEKLLRAVIDSFVPQL
jgi:photosystem II oxygen-evolving enhancer protein 2